LLMCVLSSLIVFCPRQSLKISKPFEDDRDRYYCEWQKQDINFPVDHCLNATSLLL